MTTEKQSWQIRIAIPGDAERAVLLLMAQMRDHEIPVSREHVARRVERAIRTNDPLILVATLRETVVGVAYVSFAEPIEHQGEVAWVEELYVEPAHRERGAGGALLAEVRALAERRGCVAIELETKRGHERAGHLYRRSGFRDLGRTHYALPLAAWDWGPLEENPA
jgi:GNAT superfamily N-acetyltransferase